MTHPMLDRLRLLADSMDSVQRFRALQLAYVSAVRERNAAHSTIDPARVRLASAKRIYEEAVKDKHSPRILAVKKEPYDEAITSLHKAELHYTAAQAALKAVEDRLKQAVDADPEGFAEFKKLYKPI